MTIVVGLLRARPVPAGCAARWRGSGRAALRSRTASSCSRRRRGSRRGPCRSRRAAPRATTMPTDDRSRISRHSSNPSMPGSIRSRMTISGSVASSRSTASEPSFDTVTSWPRAIRFDRTRSTMFWSSSTSRTPVRSDDMVDLTLRGRVHDGATTVARRRLRRQRDDERCASFDAARIASVPPWASTMPVAIDSPSPAPATSAPPRTCGSKMRSASASGDAAARGRAPRSRPCRRRATPAAPSTSTPVVRPRRGCTAFSSRFTTTCSRRSWSAQTGSRSSSMRHADRRRRVRRSRRPPRRRGGGRTSRAAGAGCPTRWRSSRGGRRRGAPCRADSAAIERRNRSVDSASHVRSGWHSVDA